MARGYLKEKEYRMTDISNYILELMRREHITQRDIAKELGKSQPRICRQIKEADFNISELLIIFKMLNADQDKVGRLFILRRNDG